MSDLDRIRREIAAWFDAAIRAAHDAGSDSIETSLRVMDDFDEKFEKSFAHWCTHDLWISADFREWCIVFVSAGREFFVNNETLAHLAPTASGN